MASADREFRIALVVTIHTNLASAEIYAPSNGIFSPTEQLLVN